MKDTIAIVLTTALVIVVVIAVVVALAAGIRHLSDVSEALEPNVFDAGLVDCSNGWSYELAPIRYDFGKNLHFGVNGEGQRVYFDIEHCVITDLSVTE